MQIKKNKKKSNSGLNFHLGSSENSKNGLSMGNRDKKGCSESATSGSYGVFLKKNVQKKGENVTCGGVFEEKKRKIFGVSLMNFQKMLKFHR